MDMQRQRSTTRAKNTRPTLRSKSEKVSSNPSVSVCDDLNARIATRAYELYAARGYGHGYDLEDWMQAEREVFNQVPPV